MLSDRLVDIVEYVPQLSAYRNYNKKNNYNVCICLSSGCLHPIQFGLEPLRERIIQRPYIIIPVLLPQLLIHLLLTGSPLCKQNHTPS